jgi:hypothetical protein
MLRTSTLFVYIGGHDLARFLYIAAVKCDKKRPLNSGHQPLSALGQVD